MEAERRKLERQNVKLSNSRRKKDIKKKIVGNVNYPTAISNAEKKTHADSRESKRELEIKLIRAQGECLGTKSRRRTRLTAKSHGEL